MGRFAEVSLFATKSEKDGVGYESPSSRVIAVIARDRKSKTAQTHANLG
jgi:hypothetical protein